MRRRKRKTGLMVAAMIMFMALAGMGMPVKASAEEKGVSISGYSEFEKEGVAEEITVIGDFSGKYTLPFVLAKPNYISGTLVRGWVERDGKTDVYVVSDGSAVTTFEPDFYSQRVDTYSIAEGQYTYYYPQVLGQMQLVAGRRNRIVDNKDDARSRSGWYSCAIEPIWVTGDEVYVFNYRMEYNKVLNNGIRARYNQGNSYDFCVISESSSYLPLIAKWAESYEPITTLAADLVAAKLTVDNFDYMRYAEDYPDLRAALGDDAAALCNHYITCGKAEGRKAYARSRAAVFPAAELTLENFNYAWYAMDYPELEEAYSSLVTEYENGTEFIHREYNAAALYNHYITCGKAEGRIAYAMSGELIQ